MGELIDWAGLAGLRWSEMAELSWSELVAGGLPAQLSSLAHELGCQRGRPVRVFALPMMEEFGVAGLAVPFLAEDAILLDPCLISSRDDMAQVVAYEMAHMLHPSWEDAAIYNDEEVKRFVSKLAPLLLAEPADYPMVDVAVLASPRRTMHS